MNQKNRKHKRKHPHSQGHSQGATGWKPHRDWRFWTVIIMLIAIAAYVLSLDESLTPEGAGPVVPAADAP